MAHFDEVGYTPKNLRTLIGLLQLNQRETAELLGVGLSSVQKWLAETDKVSHQDMPLAQWRKLLSYLPE